MRAFVMMRQFALSHAELTNQLRELEQRYDRQFSDIFDALGYLMVGENSPKETKERTPKPVCGLWWRLRI